MGVEIDEVNALAGYIFTQDFQVITIEKGVLCDRLWIHAHDPCVFVLQNCEIIIAQNYPGGYFNESSFPGYLGIPKCIFCCLQPSSNQRSHRSANRELIEQFRILHSRQRQTEPRHLHRVCVARLFEPMV